MMSFLINKCNVVCSKDHCSQKNIVITGSTQGIGKEIAFQMSSLGAKLVITGTNEEKLKDAKASQEAAIAAQAAIDMERTLMPPPPPGIKKVKKSESYVPITQEKYIPNKTGHPSKQSASLISLLKNKTDFQK